MHSLEGTSARGFAVNNNTIDWLHLVQITALEQSNDLTPKGGRFKPKTDQVVFFDEWKIIDIPDLDTKRTLVEMAPGTKDRRYIRIQQPFF